MNQRNDSNEFKAILSTDELKKRTKKSWICF